MAQFMGKRREPQMVQETEVKVYNVDLMKVRTILDRQATLVKKVRIKDTYFTTKLNSTIKIRIREEEGTGTLTIKTNKKYIDKHKVEQEHNATGPLSDLFRILGELGCKKREYIEMDREYYDLAGASVEICKLPQVKPFLEIEGTPAKILAAAHKLEIKEKDFSTIGPRKHFGQVSTDWTFNAPFSRRASHIKAMPQAPQTKHR